MIYIEIADSGKVKFIHYIPFDSKYGLGKSEEELKQTGYLVESIPEYTEEIPEGEIPELHYDGTDFSWVMVDKPAIPKDTDAKIADLEAQLQSTNQAVLGLMDMMNLMSM